MNILEQLKERSNSCCELCKNTKELQSYEVPPIETTSAENVILICASCSNEISLPSKNSHHWHCLNDSMWSTVPAVQITAWRILKELSNESWAQDLFDMLYLDEELLTWAQSAELLPNEVNDANTMPTKDSNGAILEAGDNVTIIKDLNVKGANFTAKRGTAVRNISLTSNPEQIEGRVNGTRIVLLTCFLKKLN